MNLANTESDWIPWDYFWTYNNGSNPSSMHISRAFIDKTQPETSLEISLLFMLIVIIFNVLKIYAMYCTFVDTEEEYFTDAVVSYLQKSESLSKGYSNCSREELLLQIGFRKPSVSEQKKRTSVGRYLGLRAYGFCPQEDMFLL